MKILRDFGCVHRLVHLNQHALIQDDRNYKGLSKNLSTPIINKDAFSECCTSVVHESKHLQCYVATFNAPQIAIQHHA